MPAHAPITLWERQDPGGIGGVRNTLSSWENCMAKSYCKWPVIAVIIIGSLILISIITCIVRCCCCGLDCCCGCFRCCNSCCPSPRGKKRSKFADDPPYAFNPPPPAQGYTSPPAPTYGAPPNAFRQGAQALPASQGPQFATFDTKKKSGNTGGINGDSLPAMPSWDNASTRRVEDTSQPEEVEMDHLPGQHEQKAPMLAHQAPSPVSQSHEYGAATATAAPYQDRAARDGGDLGNPYGQDYNDVLHGAYGSTAGANQPYGSQQTGYGSTGASTQQNYDGTSYGGTAYGVTGYSSRSPQPPVSPYGQNDDPYHQSHVSQVSYGASNVSRSPVSPPSRYGFSPPPPEPQNRYGAASPPAQASGGLPASLVPARGATPKAPSSQGYSTYTPYGQSETSSNYTAYSSQAGAGFPPTQRTGPQHSDSWRNV